MAYLEFSKDGYEIRKQQRCWCTVDKDSELAKIVQMLDYGDKIWLYGWMLNLSLNTWSSIYDTVTFGRKSLHGVFNSTEEQPRNATEQRWARL